MTYDSDILAFTPSFNLKLEETSGTTANDSSGNLRNFTNTSATVNQTPAPRRAGITAYDFNGTTSKLALASNAFMNTNTFTVIAWIEPDSVSALRCIASRDTSGAGWAFYVDATAKLNAFFPGNGNSHLGTGSLTASGRYMAAMTCNVATTQTKLYINGALDSTIAAVPVGTPSNQFRIGNSHGSNSSDANNFFYFDGRIGNVTFIAGTVLSGADISALFLSGLTQPPANLTLTARPTGIAKYVPFSGLTLTAPSPKGGADLLPHTLTFTAPPPALKGSKTVPTATLDLATPGPLLHRELLLTTRWTFYDPVLTETWTMPINPDSMTNPLPAKGLAFGRNVRSGGRWATVRQAPRPVEWEFGGVIRTQAHHDTLNEWATRRRIIHIRDHMSRTYEVMLTGFLVTERTPTRTTPWRLRYSMKGLLLRQLS